MPEQGDDDVELLAGKDVAQLFAIEPGAGGTPGGEVGNEAIEVIGLFAGQLATVLEQGPAQIVELRIDPLLDAPHLVHGLLA